jgi:protein-tyrosine phosphatase
MPDVIDLHCHILAGIDDGAGDVEEAVAMAAQAKDDGITTICATPHIRHDHDVRIPELAQRVAALNRELDHRGIAVEIARGGEVAETALTGLGRRELAEVSLAGSHWILLEPAPGPLGQSLLDAIDDLSAHGYRALIAHPERHIGNGAVEVLMNAVAAGALVQGTAAFLENGQRGPLRDLADRGLIHVLGSDSHSPRIGRPVHLSAGLAALGKIPVMRDHIRWAADTAPSAILADEPLVPPYSPH